MKLVNPGEIFPDEMKIYLGRQLMACRWNLVKEARSPRGRSRRIMMISSNMTFTPKKKCSPTLSLSRSPTQGKTINLNFAVIKDCEIKVLRRAGGRRKVAVLWEIHPLGNLLSPSLRQHPDRCRHTRSEMITKTSESRKDKTKLDK